jgi:Cdc6-like AAA superfamily ATPase
MPKRRACTLDISIPVETTASSDTVPPPVAGTVAVSGVAAASSDPVLSEEQRGVLAAVRSRRNIFLTGSAGVGKSVTLRAIIKELQVMYGTMNVAVCASTGIAAEPLGGSTLHSFVKCEKGEYYKVRPCTVVVGCSSAKTGDPSLPHQNFLNCLAKDNRERLVATEALVIDEISMVSVRAGRGILRQCALSHSVAA